MTALTLTDFLLARIAEDEAVAQEIRPDEHLRTRDASSLEVARAGEYATGAITSGRVLAECAAKRAVIRVTRGLGGYYNPDAARQAPDILRALASVYADHLDFRPEWAVVEGG